MNALWAGLELAKARLWQPRTAIAPTAALLLVAATATVERRVDPALSVDRTLLGAALGIALPLLAYVTVARVCSDGRLDRALHEVVRHGANGRLAATGLLLGSSLWTGLAGAILAGLAVAITRGMADPDLARDLLSSGWIGLLGGFGYAAWFSLGSTIGRSGGGRTVALVLDWLLGMSSGALALPWPRGHLRNLLGAEPILQLPQSGAALALAALVVGTATYTVFRCPR